MLYAEQLSMDSHTYFYTLQSIHAYLFLYVHVNDKKGLCKDPSTNQFNQVLLRS